MGTPSENLIEAEKAVNELLGTVTGLRNEAKQHADSGKLLADVSARIEKLLDSQTKIAEALQVSCDATRKVATPEILHAISELSKAVAAAQKDLDKIQALRSQLDDLSRTTARGHDEIRQLVADTRDDLGRATARAQDEIRQIVADMRKETAQLNDATGAMVRGGIEAVHSAARQSALLAKISLVAGLATFALLVFSLAHR